MSDFLRWADKSPEDLRRLLTGCTEALAEGRTPEVNARVIREVGDEFARRLSVIGSSPMTEEGERFAEAVVLASAPEPEPIEWTVPGYIPRGEPGVWAGESGVLKTTTLTNLSCAVAGGYRWLNRFDVEQAPVLIVSAEDALDLFTMRARAFCKGHGWNAARVLSNVYVLADTGATLGSPLFRMQLEATVGRVRPGLILLDPWAELIVGEENSNSEQRVTVKYIRDLARRANAAVIVSAHFGKGSADKVGMDRVRGASALTSAARAAFAQEKRDRCFLVTCLKQSRAEIRPPFVIEWHITSAPHDRYTWDSAIFTSRDATEFRLTGAKLWILQTIDAHPGIGARELEEARLTRPENAPNKATIAVVLPELVGDGYVNRKPTGPGLRAKVEHRLSDSGRQLFLPKCLSPAIRGQQTNSLSPLSPACP